MKEQCKSLNPVVAGDDSQWFVQLVDKNMRELYKIYVHLPRGFPTTPPRVSLSVALSHPWVDPKSKNVSHPGLVAWSRDSEIGRIVMDILREFTTKKPSVIQSGDEPISGKTISPVVITSSPVVIETVAMPAIPTEFPELNDLPLDKLEALDIDSVALDSFVETMAILERYKRLGAESRSRTNEVTMIVSDSYDKLLNSQFTQENNLRTIQQTKVQLDLLNEQKESLLFKFTPQNLVKDLAEVVRTTDAEHARFVAEFTSIEDVKARMIENRILHHKAAALAELLSAHSGSRVFP